MRRAEQRSEQDFDALELDAEAELPTAEEDESLTLARPAENISVAEILEIAHRVGPASNHPAWKTLDGLKLAEREAADGKTLADLQVS